MNTHFDNAVRNSIDGHLLQLGERHAVAIYRRDGVPWVAEFRDGGSELLDPATFFRSHFGTLRYSGRRHAAALESARALTPEVLERIERLHQQFEARDASMQDACGAVLASLKRWNRDLWLRLRSRTMRSEKRFG